MKSAVTFFILVVMALPGFAQQQVTVKYKLEYLATTKTRDADSNLIYKWVANTPPMEYELAINDQRASFRNNFSSIRTNTHHRFPGDTVIAYTDLSLGFNFIPVPPITEKALMVQDPAKKFSWSFTMDTDTICGFPCRMAITIVDNDYVYAWYAFDLPHNFGPLGYTGLPGTILALEFSNGPARYRAQNISDLSPEIIIPETAHIDPKEYAALMKETKLPGWIAGP